MVHLVQVLQLGTIPAALCHVTDDKGEALFVGEGVEPDQGGVGVQALLQLGLALHQPVEPLQFTSIYFFVFFPIKKI